MKLNDPVACQQFFKDQLAQGCEGLWCVSLSPNGRILELKEISSRPETPCKKSLSSVSINAETMQWLIVRVSPKQALFDESDWQWIELFLNWFPDSENEFCDYLKLGQHKYSSLLKYQAETISH